MMKHKKCTVYKGLRVFFYLEWEKVIEMKG